MYNGKKIAAIIPARKGSKGIPNKNITLLNGVPLVEYTIKQAYETKTIDKIIVSTDSEEVCNIASKYDISVKNLRPENLSNDTAILYDVIKYEIENNKLLEEKFDIIILLQPTSPLRTSTMIEDALKDFVNEGQESAVSVSEVEEHPVFMRTIDEDNQLKKVLDVDSTIRRQDLPRYYKVNGMIYINRIVDFNGEYISLNDNKSAIIIPKEYAIDIDNLEDLKRAENFVKTLE